MRAHPEWWIRDGMGFTTVPSRPAEDGPRDNGWDDLFDVACRCAPTRDEFYSALQRRDPVAQAAMELAVVKGLVRDMWQARNWRHQLEMDT